MPEQFENFFATLPESLQDELGKYKIRGIVHMLEERGVEIPRVVYDEIEEESRRTADPDYLMLLINELRNS